MAAAQTRTDSPNQSLVSDTLSSERATFPGHHPLWAVPAADRGTLPDSQPVELLFSLNRSPQLQAAFDQLLADQQNPSSPRYHQWLTPQQVGTRFGPTQHDLDALTAWLTAQGFHVAPILPSRIFIQVSAPAAVVATAFGTSLHTYQVETDDPQTLQAPASEPTLPAALAPLVAYIGGLTSVPVHTHSHAQPQTATVTTGPHPALTVNTTTHFLTPRDFNKIYDVPANLTGAGQRVMIIGGSRLAPSDLANYESLTALPAYTPTYLVDPAYADPGQTLDGTQGEATLDFDRVYGTAPGAQVDLVIAANWLNGAVNQNLILYAINSVNDPVMSLSFGACENLEPTGFVRQEDAMYAQAASQGITTLVSSGDSGVAGCAQHNVAPKPQSGYANISDICASGYVTCVGGTQFTDTVNPAGYWASGNFTGYESALSYIPEGAWNEPNNAGPSAAAVPYVLNATGGGPSTIIAKPTWQTGTGVPADGFRDTPDLAFSAAAHDGYFICFAAGGTVAQDAGCAPVQNANGTTSFGFESFSGTSATAPSMAGIAAILNAKQGSRQGNLNPTLYKLAASSPAAFHDTTLATAGLASCSVSTPSICNNSTPGPNSLSGGVPGYQLQTGYDLVTGLGSLDVGAFLNAASVNASTLTNSALVASAATITTAQTVVFTDVVSTVAATGVPTGNVVFTTNTGLTLGTFPLAANGTGNSATTTTGALSFSSPGTYIVTASFSGSGLTPSSASVTVTVTAAALVPTSTTLSGLPATVTSTTVFSATAYVTASNASASPSGTVQIIIDGVGGNAPVDPPVPTGTSAFLRSNLTLPAGTHSLCAAYSGDATFAPSTSTCATVLSTLTPVTLALTASPTTFFSSQLATLTGTLVGITSPVLPTGPVTFTDVFTPVSGQPSTINLGSPSVVGISPAGLVIGPLAVGTHVVTATYPGDKSYSAATSNSITLTVLQASVTLTPASPTLTSVAGTVATDAITVTSLNFAGTQNLTCTVTATNTVGSLPTCSLTPASVAFTGSGTATSTLSITSAKRSLLTGSRSSANRAPTLRGFGGLVLCAVFCFCLPRRTRRSLRRLQMLAAAALLTLTLAAVSGCGAGNFGDSPAAPGTSAGTYTITITAAGSTNVNAGTTISLTIQ